MTPPTVIRRNLPRARDPARDHEQPPRSANGLLNSVGPRRPVLSAEHDTALLPNVAAPGEPVAFPPVTETDWRTLTIRDAEGTAAPEVGPYLRSPDVTRKWHVTVKGLLNDIDCRLGEKSRELKRIDEVKAVGAADAADHLDYQAANQWRIRAKRLLALLRTRGTETSQAIRQLDDATFYGAAAIRKAQAALQVNERLLAWAASLIPDKGPGADWHRAMAEHWKAVLPFAGEVAVAEGPG